MKFTILILLIFTFTYSIKAQVLPNTGDPNAGKIISFSSFTINKTGGLGTPIDNFQAAILKDGLGEKYLVVLNSGDWLKATKSRPNNISLYETPGNAAHVVLDFINYKFKFYPWNVKDFSGNPHHTNTILNFIGTDHKPHSISFADFVGR